MLKLNPHHYPFGSPLPGRQYTVPYCYTDTIPVTDTTFYFNGLEGAAWAPIGGATINEGFDELEFSKTGILVGGDWGGSTTTSFTSGTTYTLSLDLNSNCVGAVFNIKLINASGTIATYSFVSTGSHTYTFTPSATGAATLQAFVSGTLNCNFSFNYLSITSSDYITQYVCNNSGPGCKGNYRYGFNGQEKDDEVSGNGNSNTAEYWQYDTRLGRRWNIDAIGRESESLYATFFNNPIFVSDPDGDTGDPNKKEGTLTTTIYLERAKDAKGNYLTSDKQFNDVVNDFKALNGKVIGNYNGKKAVAKVNVVVVSEKPKAFGVGENYFSVGTSGISHVNGDKTTGIINVLNNYSAKTAFHEWGHLFGLKDRYLPAYKFYEGGDNHHTIETAPESRETVALKSIPGDPEYDPYNNVYGNGSSQITTYQLGVLFGDITESSYFSGTVLYYGSDKGLIYNVVEVSQNGNKIVGYIAGKTNSKTNNVMFVKEDGTGNLNGTPFKCIHKDHNSASKKSHSSILMQE